MRWLRVLAGACAATVLLTSCSQTTQGGTGVYLLIDTASFTERNIIAKATFDDRPSAVNQQKRAFAGRIQAFTESSTPSPFTDITGGVLQAIELLNEKQPGRKEILIFSDMKEDLAKGYVRDIPLDLRGFEVVALNVTKLRSDNIDPREHLGRLEAWRKRVEKAGGTWRVINDLEWSLTHQPAAAPPADCAP